jgi:hypothetical protein
MPHASAAATAPPSDAGAPDRRLWHWYLTLASPFLLCLAVLLVTGRTLPVFWGDSDEGDHWALTRWFAERLPHFEPIYPHSATTPLFHLVGACVVRLFGPHLVLVRSLNVAISLAGVFALFRLLQRSMRHGPATAALLSGVFLTSCYFFGYSFRWLTDNLALTLCILALGQLFRFADPAEPRRLGSFLCGCLWCGLTILTRQSYMFVCLPFAVALLMSGMPAASIAIGFGGLALAVAPFAALVLAWHGLVPPDYHGRHAASPVMVYPVTLPLMLLGFYAPFFVGWREAGSINPRRFLWPGIVGAGGLVALWMFPLVPTAGRPDLSTYFPVAARQDVPGYFAGWIYNVASHLPKLHGNSLLFWVLLPIGLAAATRFLLDAASNRSDGRQRTAAFFLLGLLLSSFLNGICAQKYYDAPVLLFLIWRSRGEAARDPWRRAALGALIFLFAAYFAIFVGTAKTPVASPGSPAGSHPAAI